jgi:hypothetical protein
MRLNCARLGQVAVGVSPGACSACAALRVVELVGAEALLAVRQSTSGSVKPPTWPDASQTCGWRMIDESSATMSSRSLHHRLEPARLDVVLQQDAVVAVVVRRAEAAVDLRRREHEPAPLQARRSCPS